MALTPREVKFLTMMNETRLSDGKLFKRDLEAFSKIFSFSEKELHSAVKKLVDLGMLSQMKLGGNEIIYFHTDKVSESELDEELKVLRR
jgi:hypothetical protein